MLRTLGLSGIVGAVLLIAALGLWRFDLIALGEREAALRDRVAARERVPSGAVANAKLESIPGNERLRAFYEHFASSGRATEALAHLHAIGRHLGLDTGQAEYRLQALRDTPLYVYTVTLPLAGSYAALRTFAEHALQQLPNAALDSARFERRGPGTNIEATLTFSLFLVTP